MLLFPSNKWGKWSTEELSNLLKNTQPIKDRAHPRNRALSPLCCTPSFLLAFLERVLWMSCLAFPIVVVQSLSHIQLFVTPRTATCQACLSFTISHSLLKFMSIESVMLSNHLIFCHTLLLLLSILPSIRVFSNELALHIRWPKDWSFSFSISPSHIQSWFPLGLIYLISLAKIIFCMHENDHCILRRDY